MPRYSTVVIVDDETRRHHQIKNLKIFKDKLIDFYEDYVYPVEQTIVHSMNVVAAGRIVDIINESSIGGAIRIPADELARHY